jgi:hypothetical protein
MSRRRSRGATLARMDAFWVIMVYIFVFGVGALVGFVFWYWFAVVPEKVAPQPARTRRR